MPWVMPQASPMLANRESCCSGISTFLKWSLFLQPQELSDGQSSPKRIFPSVDKSEPILDGPIKGQGGGHCPPPPPPLSFKLAFFFF